MTAADSDMESDIERAAVLISAAKHVVALTGAGVSVESGVRPFRGPGGLWTERGEPAMDGYQRFLADPKREWERTIRREGYLKDLFEAFETARPNPGHHALAELERIGVLKCLMTQNVDNLHRAAGNKNIAEIHGNFLLLRCIKCNSRYSKEEILLDELPPRCPKCCGIVKNDSVHFGEPIPPDVLRMCQDEILQCDCMILAGTSGFVYPAAGFPHMVKQCGGLLIEINPHPTELTHACDVALRGTSADVLPRLVSLVRATRA